MGPGRAFNVAMRTLPIFLLVLSACSAPAAALKEAPKRVENVQVVPLQYSNADELASTLRSLFARNPEIRILADSRTNSLLIAADAGEIAQIEGLVQRIDVEVKPAH
jgi:type II secretory pathway component GspD/PulD (secretin)